uniref:Uncharacterized protein n=1 Tax=Oryza sativa subsp. japonica TaxID=39947 RepID=Q2QQW0_ORYSJ|nr:hypothetical protein LOC_Os12g29680 [Oryza sativa Japonica Group]
MAEALVCLQAVQLASELGVSKLLIMTSFFQKENGITLKSQNPTKAEQLGMEQASESCLPPLPISLEPKTSTASKATEPYIQNSIPSVGCTICKSNLKITKATACLSIQELRSLVSWFHWLWHRNPIGPKLPSAPKFPSTSRPQRGGRSAYVKNRNKMQEQHSRCFIQGTEAAEVTPLMEPYMLLLSANAESGNMTRVNNLAVWQF